MYFYVSYFKTKPSMVMYTHIHTLVYSFYLLYNIPPLKNTFYLTVP